jgi:hypothetical protein
MSLRDHVMRLRAERLDAHDKRPQVMGEDRVSVLLQLALELKEIEAELVREAVTYTKAQIAVAMSPEPNRTFATVRVDDTLTRIPPRAGYMTGKRAFFYCDDGTKWAIPDEHERAARQRDGSRVIIEIRSPDDQFALLVSYV